MAGIAMLSLLLGSPVLWYSGVLRYHDDFGTLGTPPELSSVLSMLGPFISHSSNLWSRCSDLVDSACLPSRSALSSEMSMANSGDPSPSVPTRGAVPEGWAWVDHTDPLLSVAAVASGCVAGGTVADAFIAGSLVGIVSLGAVAAICGRDIRLREGSYVPRCSRYNS